MPEPKLKLGTEKAPESKRETEMDTKGDALERLGKYFEQMLSKRENIKRGDTIEYLFPGDEKTSAGMVKGKVEWASADGEIIVIKTESEKGKFTGPIVRLQGEEPWVIYPENLSFYWDKKNGKLYEPGDIVDFQIHDEQRAKLPAYQEDRTGGAGNLQMEGVIVDFFFDKKAGEVKAMIANESKKGKGINFEFPRAKDLLNINDKDSMTKQDIQDYIFASKK
ncbi:hypothetical protein JW977_01235 [Candidatus Falkowbacteria bacterium]|nr:hypothetical protein [Candidatus Falkowbacteria bacterium]